jgi:hypothetical protein
MMQQAIAVICLLGAMGIVGYFILAVYVGWKVMLIPLGLAVVICAIIRRDRKIHGPM